MVTRALLVVAMLGGVAAAQPAPSPRITIGIYTPSVEFGAATTRLAYVRGLGAAIERATGIAVDAQSYANLAALVRANLDFAIVDGPCVATHPRWRLLATATVGGGTTRAWGLFVAGAGGGARGVTIDRLRGKRLAYPATGCDDAGFVDHAMLDSELDPKFFGARVGKADLTAALAEVASYRTAQAVFAPIASARGLTKVFDTGAVPNPGFVALSNRLSPAVVGQVTAAVLGHPGGAIGGWTRGARPPYAAFAARLRPAPRRAVFATPDPFRLDPGDLVREPDSLRTPAAVPVRRHFVRADRLE